MESWLSRIHGLSNFSLKIKYISYHLKLANHMHVYQVTWIQGPKARFPITLPRVFNYPWVHSKPLSNIFWADVCAWTQLDCYLLWDHIRRCSWLFTTMTFSVSLCGPSQQASETWALCYNAPLCPWRMASWLWCGPGKFSGWVAAPKSIWTFQRVLWASWPGLSVKRKIHWKRAGSKVRVFCAGLVLRQSV